MSHASGWQERTVAGDCPRTEGDATAFGLLSEELLERVIGEGMALRTDRCVPVDNATGLELLASARAPVDLEYQISGGPPVMVCGALDAAAGALDPHDLSAAPVVHSGGESVQFDLGFCHHRPGRRDAGAAPPSRPI